MEQEFKICELMLENKEMFGAHLTEKAKKVRARILCSRAELEQLSGANENYQEIWKKENPLQEESPFKMGDIVFTNFKLDGIKEQVDSLQNAKKKFDFVVARLKELGADKEGNRFHSLYIELCDKFNVKNEAKLLDAIRYLKNFDYAKVEADGGNVQEVLLKNAKDKLGKTIQFLSEYLVETWGEERDARSGFITALNDLKDNLKDIDSYLALEEGLKKICSEYGVTDEIFSAAKNLALRFTPFPENIPKFFGDLRKQTNELSAKMSQFKNMTPSNLTEEQKVALTDLEKNYPKVMKNLLKYVRFAEEYIGTKMSVSAVATDSKDPHEDLSARLGVLKNNLINHFNAKAKTKEDLIQSIDKKIRQLNALIESGDGTEKQKKQARALIVELKNMRDKITNVEDKVFADQFMETRIKIALASRRAGIEKTDEDLKDGDGKVLKKGYGAAEKRNKSIKKLKFKNVDAR